MQSLRRPSAVGLFGDYITFRRTKVNRKIRQNDPLKPEEVVEISSNCHQRSSDYRRVYRTQKEGEAETTLSVERRLPKT